MSTNEKIEIIRNLTESLLDPDTFLVDIKIKPTHNIKVYLDADQGLAIEKCIRINRALYKILEEKAVFEEDDFSLEVSSPGIDQPLKLHRQYVKNRGRDLEVSLLDNTVKSGKLISVSEEAISLEYTEGKGKKAEIIRVEIPFSEIKQASVQIKF
ncbi:MAG: ribosome maturation factor [Chitinophagaceae bacterium]|nr:ribosome maturation factor [Chitinophagaceae bacterium]